MEYSYPLHIDPINIVEAEPEGHYSKDGPTLFRVRDAKTGDVVESVQFQDGSALQDHIPGVHNEDLLIMVLARLRAFQESEFRCRENALAITKIEEALNFLCLRTQERRSRKVEGIDKS